MAPRKNKLKLTNAIIPKLESSYTWDTEVNQFGCRYFPKSGKRTFILRYRGINRKQREFRIGVFPAMSVTTARDTAKQLIGQIMLGNDPQHERKLKMHRAITFADVVDGYVIWASQNAKRNSIGEIDTFTRLHIKPRFGDQYICDMTIGLVQRVYDKLVTKLSISYTNKMIDWARTIWNWGKKREMAQVIGNSTKVNEEHYWHLLEDYRREISEKIADKIVSFRE